VNPTAPHDDDGPKDRDRRRGHEAPVEEPLPDAPPNERREPQDPDDPPPAKAPREDPGGPRPELPEPR